MAQRNDSGVMSFEADEAIEIYSRVILEADGKIVKAGITGREIGTVLEAAIAAGEVVPVKLVNAPGTHKVRTKEALAVGAILYTEAAGEVQDTAASTSFMIGQAVTASAAENEVVEMIYMFGPTTAVA